MVLTFLCKAAYLSERSVNGYKLYDGGLYAFVHFMIK